MLKRLPPLILRAVIICYIKGVSYNVKVTRKAMKGLASVPKRIQEAFYALASDLAETGPVQAKWMNYSRLEGNKYHFHLAHKWVACWTNENRVIEIEVYYVGSRENAPY